MPKGILEKGQAYLIQAGMLQLTDEKIPILLPLGQKTWMNLLYLLRKYLQEIDVQEIEIPVSINNLSAEKAEGKQVSEDRLMTILIEILNRHISSYRDLPVKLGFSKTVREDRTCLLSSRASSSYQVFSIDSDHKEQLDSSGRFQEVLTQIFKVFGLSSLQFFQASGEATEEEESFEFVVETKMGSDEYFHCTRCDYIASKDLAKSNFPTYLQDKQQKPLKRIHGPDLINVKDLAEFAGISIPTTTKTLVFETEQTKRLIAVMIRGDYDVSEPKLENIVGEDLYLAPALTIREVFGTEVGYTGVVDLPKEVELIADLTVQERVNFECGANETDYHLLNVNFNRDLPKPEEFYDVRQIKEGETCPKCEDGGLKLFKAATAASFDPLSLKNSGNAEVFYIGEDGKRHPIFLGKLKLFLANIFALLIQNSWDENGLIWPKEITPFHAHLISIGGEEIFRKAEMIYHKLRENDVAILWDDRDKKAGVKFNDADLIGIPIRLVIGKKSFQEGCVEWTERGKEEVSFIPDDQVIDKIKKFYKD
jgi:prolyl-tRNA synthetase